MELELSKTIERLREQLVVLVREQGFSSVAVIELSQYLDQYILEAQRKGLDRDPCTEKCSEKIKC